MTIRHLFATCVAISFAICPVAKGAAADLPLGTVELVDAERVGVRQGRPARQDAHERKADVSQGSLSYAGRPHGIVLVHSVTIGRALYRK